MTVSSVKLGEMMPAMSPDTGSLEARGITPLASAALGEDSGAVAEQQGSFRADLPAPPPLASCCSLEERCLA